MSKDLWKLQDEFTRKFWATKGGMPAGEPALTHATKDYLLHLMKEVTEVLDQVSFKMHRLPKEYVDRNNTLEEMIDCQKFLWGLMQVWGFTYEDFANEFRRKSAVVEQRFAQERAMQELKNERCVLVDIDGVLSDYPSCLYAWLADKWITNSDRAKTLWERTSLDEKETIKREYRQSGIKAKLPVLPGAKELLHELRQRGVKIVLLTNRPYAEHFRIYGDTLEWLKANDLVYDAIIWARDKGFEAVHNFKNICWAVDDTTENIIRLAGAGVQAIQVRPHVRGDTTQDLLDILKRTEDVRDVPKQWNTLSSKEVASK